MRRVREVARLAAPVLAVLLLAGCSKDPEDKLVDWPPREDVVPVGLPVEVDTVSSPEPDTAAPEVAMTDVAPPPLPPCRALVEYACELWTPFSDACREARTRVPDDTHPPTREACAALLEAYRTRTSWGNPCGRYARAVCAQAGESAERCKAARARVPILDTRREWRACIADLLWFDALALRR